MALRDVLAGLADHHADAFRPRLFSLGRDEDCRSVERLAAGGQIARACDTMMAQLAELVAMRQPSRDLTFDEIAEAVRSHLGGVEPWRYGTWVHYPWSRTVVHILPEAEFRELRSDRNRYKITPTEQRRLAACTIGIVGLSVGHACAVTLALEGVGGHFRLADFDALSISNMNRLRAGIQDLGVSKAVLAARQIAEIDPYLDVRLFPEGISETNVESFLTEGGKVDLVVEECDDLHAKVFVRERARAHGVPVLMDTSDRGLLDVERFDREPGRPILHGLIGSIDARSLKGLKTKDKLPFVLRILGETAMSDRLAGSLVEIKETLSSWPQLASGVALGGALITDTARRILLGQLEASGRFYVDLERIVRDGGQESLAQPAPTESGAARADVPFLPIPRGASPNGPTEDQIRAVVAHAILAPSAGNAQPWKFRYRHGRLQCLHDVSRTWAFLDFEYGATYVALGAAVENMVLAAASMGLCAHVEPFPHPGDPTRVCDIRFEPGEPQSFEELRRAIPVRATNRRNGPRQALEENQRSRLRLAATFHGATLRLCEAEAPMAEMAELGRVVGEADRLVFLNERMHREVMSEIRWSRAEAIAAGDGIDIDTLELSPADKAAFRMLAHWPAMRFVLKIGGGSALTTSATRAVDAASAMGLLVVPGTAPASYFTGGRALERVWLTATTLGLFLLPMATLPYLLARLERGGGEGLSASEKRSLEAMRGILREIWPTPRDHAEVLLFRLFRGEPPTARSCRRQVDDVLSFA